MGREILSPPDLSPVGGVPGDEQQNSFSNISNQSPSTSNNCHQHKPSPTSQIGHHHKVTNITMSPTQSTPKKKDRFGDQIEKSLEKDVRRMKK